MIRADAALARPTATLTAVAAAVLLALTAAPAAAQQGGADDTASADGAASADSLLQEGDVEYQREVFDYPVRDRNPFEPVTAGVEEGPRFQNLVLAGIIFSPSVGSVAVVVDRSTGQRFRVREGERIGQATVLNIRRSDVQFSVAGATQSRQETLQVEKRNEEVQR